ncbi:MAG: ribosome maturation factor RimP [Acidimicrobiales bacterium]
MAIADRVRELAAPLVEAEGVELYHVEHVGGVVRVLVDAPDGVAIDRIARLTRAISRSLDEHDPVPGRYTLEVSSPGLERPLHTLEHWRCALGADVKIKTKPDHDGPRRIRGTIVAVHDRAAEVEAEDGLIHLLEPADVVSARTTFEWGPGPKPGGGSGRTDKTEREATSP